MSLGQARFVFLGAFTLAMVGVVVMLYLARGYRRRRFDARVKRIRESGCTCDYSFDEGWLSSTVTRKHDCPVHGRGGTSA